MVLPERSLKTMILVRFQDVEQKLSRRHSTNVNPRTGQKDGREVDDKMERGGGSIGLETTCFLREICTLECGAIH